MKTKHLFIITIALLLPCLAIAQSASKAIFDKYSGQEGFTSVSISGELFQMLASDSGDVDISGHTFNTKDFDLSHIKGIKMLSISPGTDNKNLKQAEEVLKEVDAALKKDKLKYSELVQVTSSGENINVMALKANPKKVQEIVIYRKNSTKKETSLIYIEGPFEEEMVNKVIKESMNK